MPLVLLVEDHDDTREMYSHYLRNAAGFSVIDDPTPETAFARILDLHPDVVVTDYRMSPVNGLELCRQLRAHPETSHVPLIMLTAHTVAADLEAFRAVCAAVIVKPCLPEQLAHEISRVIADSTSARTT
jgi:two-component system phosphate regulon response regulator PhoB